ncbi:MAG: MerR family transcriptional regulator [Woeseia sp.]
MRYYEQMGLLKPRRQGGNGYRLYAIDDLKQLEFIFRTKKAGFTIRQIPELLDLWGTTHATCRLGRELANEQIAVLNEVRKILVEFAAECEMAGLDQPCNLSFHLEPVLFDRSFFRSSGKA